jgi:predicted acylesterase/phospholipase RssA
MSGPGTATPAAKQPDAMQPDAIPPVEPPAPPPAPPEPRLVGEDGCPIRAIAFSSGGFETAMQLGLTHALLVIQGKPPDAVVGISAGAISAVALAEIFQADAVPLAGTAAMEPEPVRAAWVKKLEARVKRFREVFDGYQRAPSELIEAAKPDALQLNARIPLKPLELPIHHKWERIGRQDSLQSRAGLINLYNQLLELRMSWGTITQAVRRGLGIEAAPELRPNWKGVLAVIGESVRAWILLGFNLLLVAPLVWPLTRPFFRSGHSRVRGESAAAVIFRSRFFRRLMHIGAATLRFVLLAAFWFGASFLVVIVIPWLLGHAAIRFGMMVGWDKSSVLDWIAAHPLQLTAGLLGAIALAIIIIGTYWWRPLLSLVRQLGADVFDFALLVSAGFGAIWLAVFGWRLASSIAADNTLRVAITAATSGSLHVPAIVVGALALFALVSGVILWLTFPKDYTRRLLAGYDLADGLFSEHPLRQLLISTLDPGYYGNERIDDIVDRALRDDTSPSDVRHAGRQIGYYSSDAKVHPIHVGIAVANVASGELETLNDYVYSVDGLLAATAITPLFRPQKIEGKLYVDGSNISTEATHLVTDFLRKKVNPKSTVVHVYTVVALPFTRGALEGPTTPYLTLVEVVTRALQLQRFRDASMERTLTELYTQIIPPAGGVRLETDRGHKYLRAWVTPVEPERPLTVGRDLLAAPDKITRRDVIACSVADGCRAALEVMIRPSLGPLPQPPDPATVLSCRAAVKAHMLTRLAASGPDLPIVSLPGSDPDGGPGLSEVCQHCALQSRDRGAPDDRTIKQSIRVQPWTTMGPAWPHEMETKCEPADRDPHFYRAPSADETKTHDALLMFADAMAEKQMPDMGRWPRVRDTLPGSSRPLVSLLFSGGVFRGVYQMGVLTALSEVDVQPDIIAGASVGSITAALVAESFSQSRGTHRDGRIARLAATYLALDRLVLTDRFADFIRNFTLRAAATGFSLRQVDRFLRRYDSASAGTFDSEARLVMAGLERLLYVSPFELKDLVKAFRGQNMPQITILLHRYLQEWLERMGCGNQLLGAEPLAFVITEHVLAQMAPSRKATAPIPFDAFLHRSGIYFLATATNLTRGRLEVLGEQQLIGGGRQAVLLEGLLASSAFPGVFRPRWSWELMPGTATQDQYIDGGVMDNLPLDAVAQFLFRAAEAKLVAARPTTAGGIPVPHLLFSASLEKDEPPLSPNEVNLLADNWVKLFGRAKALKYNKKLNGYAEAQRSVRDIWTTSGVAAPGALLVPLDLEVATVIPKWLCGTFAFHPMLGFRRARQAESIAHGCASTLIALGVIVRDHQTWASGWGIDGNEVPTNDYVSREDPYAAATENSAPPNHCWLRPQTVCPFSRPRVEPLGLQPQTVIELEKIHLACRRRQTHEPH